MRIQIFLKNAVEADVWHLPCLCYSPPLFYLQYLLSVEQCWNQKCKMRLKRSQLLIKGSTVLSCWPTNLNASDSDVIQEKAFTGVYLCLLIKNKEVSADCFLEMLWHKSSATNMFLWLYDKKKYFKQSLYYSLKEKSTAVPFISLPVLPSRSLVVVGRE